jgi:hypothetical protein
MKVQNMRKTNKVTGKHINDTPCCHTHYKLVGALDSYLIVKRTDHIKHEDIVLNIAIEGLSLLTWQEENAFLKHFKHALNLKHESAHFKPVSNLKYENAHSSTSFKLEA